MAYNPKSSENLRHWQKGQSGNPGGRPSLDRMIRDYIEKENPSPEKGSQETFLQGIIEKLCNRALEGDLRAAGMILDRAYGRPTPEVLRQNDENWIRRKMDL